MNRWVMGLVVVLSSCSQDIAPEDFCDAYDELANCQRAKNCGWAAFDVSCDEILAKYEAGRGCFPTATQKAIDAGWLVYDGHAARTCLESMAKDCSPSSFECPSPYLIAQQPVGAPCWTSRDCIDGACDATRECAGTCLPLDPIGPQTDGGVSCRMGLAFIVPVDAPMTYRCAAPFARGEVCWGPAERFVGGKPCIEFLDECPQPTDGGSSVCVPSSLSYASSGSYVTRGGDCSAGIGGGQFCQQGLACRADGRCGSRIERGGSCALDARGCELDSTCVDGLCVPMRALGEPCGGYETRCAPDLRCKDMACEKPRLEGAPCANDLYCEAPLLCVDGVCGETVCR